MSLQTSADLGRARIEAQLVQTQALHLLERLDDSLEDGLWTDNEKSNTLRSIDVLIDNLTRLKERVANIKE